MTIADRQREESGLASLEIAATWRGKANSRMELSCLSSAITSFLSVAVSRFSTIDDGVAFLQSHDAGTVLRRVADLNNQLYQLCIQSNSPPSSAVDNSITPIHIAWLLQEWNAAHQLLAICMDPRVAKFFPLSKFWAEYLRAICCLTSDTPYAPALIKTAGFEKCWTPYLSLIADLTNNRDTSASREELGRIFLARNRDKRLVDWQMIDGDGKHPVQWDFREASILAYVEHSRKAAS